MSSYSVISANTFQSYISTARVSHSFEILHHCISKQTHVINESVTTPHFRRSNVKAFFRRKQLANVFLTTLIQLPIYFFIRMVTSIEFNICDLAIL